MSCRMDVAAKYGTDAAIFVNNIVFWTLKNKAENRHFHNGRFWTYGTISGFSKLYPLWSISQLKRIISRCRDAGILLVGDFNEDRRDRTLWYSPSDEIMALYDDGTSEICMEQNRTMQSTNSENAKYEFGKSYIRKQVDIPPIVPQELNESFSDFWDKYPKKVKKKEARELWMRLKPDHELVTVILRALDRQKCSSQWKKNDGQYVPNPTTWIRGQMWEDELPGIPQSEPEVELKKPKRYVRTDVIDGQEVDVYE